jgi:hypothetical protein
MNAPPRKSAARRALGRLALNAVHRPLGGMRRMIAEGGPVQQYRTEQGRRAMIEAARMLPPIAPPKADRGASVAFLSGADYWYQTLFCFASLQRFSAARIVPALSDDGTLCAQSWESFRRVAPWAELRPIGAIEDRLDRLLPVARFPTLRARRIVYPHLRKLTDVHLGATGWTLVLDSDLLVFRRPQALLDWFERPAAIYLRDVATMYGYPPAFMKTLSGARLLERVNVGAYALHAPSIDWSLVEFWCRRQIEEHGANYLQEQALTALLLSRQGARPLSQEDYVVRPGLKEGRDPKAIMHHYVAHSKRAYFQYGWRNVAARLRAPEGHDRDEH